MIGQIASLASDTGTHRSSLQVRAADAARQLAPPPAAGAMCVAANGVRVACGPALQVEVHRLVWFVGILAFTCGIVLFVIGVIRKMPVLTAFVNGFILVIVANVPEVRAGVTQEKAYAGTRDVRAAQLHGLPGTFPPHPAHPCKRQSPGHPFA